MKKKTDFQRQKPAKKPSAQDDIRNIWMITREYEGLAGAGGVKDVCRQSAEAYARNGFQITVVIPLYGFMEPEKLGFSKSPHSFAVDMNYVGVERREQIEIWLGHLNGVRLFLLGADRFAEKNNVYTYTAEDEKRNPFNRQGTSHFDYFATNILLQKGAVSLAIHLDERPDIIHCHDGHTAVLPAMVNEVEGFRHFFHAAGSLVTIHNAGNGYHQEVDDLPFAQAITGLPQRTIYENQLNGKFDPFLVAAQYAVLNTVSENYARELQETEQDRLTGGLGHKLLARGIKLCGITNGINPADFDPRQAEKLGLAAAYDPLKGDLAGKAACRRQLVEIIGKSTERAATGNGLVQAGFLENRPEDPLFTFVGRFTSQKGVDKLIGALESLMTLDSHFQIAIVGSGTREIENSLIQLTRLESNRGRIVILRGYDPQLANLVYAAGDFFLIPSQFEPCGLTDFIAQLFGNLPVVHHTGGLVKVEEGVNGFAYSDHSSAALMGAMQKAISTFRDEPSKISRMQKDAIRIINKRYTWDVVIQRYLELYRQAKGLTERRGCPPEKNL